MTPLVRPAYHRFLMTALILAALALCVLLSATASRAAEEESPGLNLAGALRHAYLHNPSLNAARAQLLSTHELLPQADAGWKPTVAADASVTASKVDGSNFGGGDGSTAKDVELSLNQPLFRGGRTFAEINAAKHLIGSQNQLLRAREQDVLLAAATAYMDVYRDQALVDLSLNNREVIARELEATNIRFEVGELTKTDISQAEARLAAADANVISARGALKTSMAVFQQIVGMPPEDLVPPEIALAMPENLDQAVLEAENNSPLVLSAISVHKASKEDIGSRFGNLLPEVGLFSAWNRTYDPIPGLIEEQTTETIGISASIPLYQAGAERSRVREAKHTANQRYLEVLDVRNEVRQQAVSSWENWQAAQAEIVSRRSQVEASAVAQEGVRSEAELGTRTVLDTLDADQEAFDARVALITAERNEVVARFSLMATMGLLAPQTLGFPEDAKDYSGQIDQVRWKIFDMDVDRVGEEG